MMTTAYFQIHGENPRDFAVFVVDAFGDVRSDAILGTEASIGLWHGGRRPERDLPNRTTT